MRLSHRRARSSAWPPDRLNVCALSRRLVSILGFVAACCSTNSAVQPAKMREEITAPAPLTQSVPAQTKAGGELVLLSLDPPIGSTLTEGSVIRAAFEYRLINQDQIAIYALVPFFSDRAGEGRTFNALTDPTSVLRLMAPSGRVEMHYSVAAEWSNAYRLAKPPEVWFDLVERYPRSGTRVVAELGPFRFNSP